MFFTIPVLVYNCIGYYPDEEVMENGVTPENFERQMKYFKDNGYNAVSPDKLVMHLQHGEKLSRKSVVITFDYGFKDSYLNALPILKKYNFTATVFLPTDYVGKRIPFCGSEVECLNWNEIRKMVDYGVTIGSHGRRGRVLGSLDMEEAKSEIIESKKNIEKEMGKECKYFSLTEQNISPDVKKLLSDAGYIAAFSLAPLYEKPDIYTISRIKIDNNDDMPTYKTKLSFMYGLFQDSKHWKFLRGYKLDRLIHRFYRAMDRIGLS